MDLKLLRKKDFALLMIGKLVSLIGTRVQSLALSIYVLGLTGSATKFASVLAITFIPDLILGPIAGVFVDWFDRKKIIVVLDFIRGIIIGGFAVLFFIRGSFSMGEIYLLVISLSVASLIFQPAISTVIPSLVKKDNLMDANGINSTIMNMGNLIAPAIAGVVLGRYGMLVILIMNSISFIISAISEMFINIPKTHKKPEKISFKAFTTDFKEGLVFIKEKKLILNIILLGVFLNFLFQPIGSMGRVFVAKEVFLFSDDKYGLMESILVIPMFIAPFVASWLANKIEIGKIIVIDMLITGVFGLVLASITTNLFISKFGLGMISYIVLVAIGFMIIFVTSIGNISLFTMFQKEVDLKVMGRVNTVMSTGLMAMTPVGQMFFGYMFDKVDPWMSILLGAGGILVVTMFMGKRLCNVEKKEVPEAMELACSQESNID